MLKALIKKQISEVFKSYFYDAKKNKARSKGTIAAWFLFYAFIMAGVLGGIFFNLSKALCPSLSGIGFGWFYFLLMTGISIVLGAFGSVFNTFSSLYLSKDNDLLLSMPIPPEYIIISRLINVYLLGTMYSAVVIIPAIIVYIMNTGISAASVIGGIALLLIISGIVLVLSCLLGWVVAKISLKLKNKSFITVIVSLLFIGGYYFVYFKANTFISTLVQNASEYGEKIKGSAYLIYLFGKIGEGNIKAAAIYFIACAAVVALTCFILSKTFLGIATSSSRIEKKIKKEKAEKQKSVSEAILCKEFAKLASSPNYMLNCALGVITIPACGIVMLIKGNYLLGMLGSVFEKAPDFIYILLCATLCILASMNDTAAPSVSLEGKNLWITQSLPVSAGKVLLAKMEVQLIITEIPLLFSAICLSSVIDASPAVKILMCIVPLLFGVFSAAFASVIGIKLPNLSWTNEIVPIKQSACVFISLFGGMAFVAASVGIYYLLMKSIGIIPYMAALSAVFAAASVLMIHWLNTKGAKLYAEL